jgi:hypothetical protein
MADPRDEEELERARADEEERRPALSDEIARRWDPAQISKMVKSRGSAGQPLDALTRARYERQFGVDLGEVRIHTGPFAQHVTRQHSAEAVTVGGTGMIFMAGTPDRSPVTAAGQALLAHELTHVAQAARGIYRSAPGEPAPLATEEHEHEAHAVEAAELAQASGGGREQGPPPMSEQELLAQVIARVCELLYEEERVHEQRNGLTRIRP